MQVGVRGLFVLAIVTQFSYDGLGELSPKLARAVVAQGGWCTVQRTVCV